MAVFETWLKTDLQKPLNVVQLTGNLFSADNGGNLIGVEVFDNGSPASLSGTVTGYVIRSDSATVTIEGTLNNNKAYIVLPSSAYAKVGEVRIVIKVGEMTVGACVSYVYQTTTDTIVDPGHVIPSIAELLAQIGACRTATANANKVANLTVSAEVATGSTPDAVLSEDQQTGNKHITFKLVKGETGDTGPRGETGATPDFSIGTVQSGATPAATITGTPEHPVLNLTMEKGDPGNDATVYIRYAATEPTQDSDMKTTPDEWIGIYAGYAATAPTTYTSYTWYKFKGETGSIDNAYGSTIPMGPNDSTKIATAIEGKTDKINGGASGNFVSLDGNGNIQDSGHNHGDYITDVSGKVNTDSFAVVANGDTHSALTAGDCVYVINNGNLAEGLYRVTTNVGQNVALTTLNTAAVPRGAINKLNSDINTLYSRLPKIITQSVTYSDIKAGEYSTDMETTITNVPTGLTPIGVCGYELSGSYYTQMVVVKNYVSEGKLYSRLRSYSSAARTITGTYYILCAYVAS